MHAENLLPALTTRKHSRESPFVDDYRPYTGRQLMRALENKATPKKHWDLYYRNNTLNGYRDRHYILREFHELHEELDELKKSVKTPLVDIIWMEAGCGVGNAIFPILEEYGDVRGWRVVGFDISSIAITLLREKLQSFKSSFQEKVSVCVLNPVEKDITVVGKWDLSPARHLALAAGTINFVSMIFVLCSIPVENHMLVLQRIAACMKEGGIFFFRDYCVDDYAERRFSAARCIEENTFARSNGTLSHFFSVAEVQRLFEDAGFKTVELLVVERDVSNRKKGVNMHRRFLQGRFCMKKREEKTTNNITTQLLAEC